jgi:hypothetical protein
LVLAAPGRCTAEAVVQVERPVLPDGSVQVMSGEEFKEKAKKKEQ